MKTNLIFKRQVNTNGIVSTHTRIVPVDIPEITSGEGWVLNGHSDVIEVMKTSQINILKDEEKTEPKKYKDPTRFTSTVAGTAKLVRVKDTIKIVSRKGKAYNTYNANTLNSVCISDDVKVRFFNECKECFGSSTNIFEFTSEGVPSRYAKWSKFIDDEYTKQKMESLK